VSRSLLFEIGVEEIPSAALYDAITWLKTASADAVREARLEYGEIEVYGAPRRLVVRVSELADRQEDRTLRARGPAVKAAFDAEGNPTKAAEGFARGKGIDVAALERVSEEGGEYVYAIIDQPGQPAAEILPELLADLAGRVPWPKSQRWGSGSDRFIRPVRWLLALFGDEVVPVRFAGLQAGRLTWGHRFLAEENPIPLANPEGYESAATRGLFVFDQERRAALVREGIAAIEAQRGVRAVVPEKTLAEVVNLVEWPTVTVGSFDEEFLGVPREIIETAMTKHQRYFPVEGADGNLTNAFIVVHNGDTARSENIVAGHERVIRARLADATFFYAEDLKRPLEAYVAELERITFQEKLGTLAAKVARVEALAGALGELADGDPAAVAEAVRAAHLCKADLVSHAVIEFPVLQGVMGSYYAGASGESPAVAAAITEHYLPRFAGDVLPASDAGRLVSVADKLDTMVGIFGIGMPPTGSADPYALRRGALGILAIIIDGLPITLDEAIAAALEGYRESHDFDVDAVGAAVKEFIVARLEGVLRDRGHAYDTVDALLAVASDDPADAVRRCEALTAARTDSPETFEDLSTAFSRAKNLGQPDLGTETDASIMGAEEAVLADALAAAEQVGALSFDAGDYPAFLGILAGLRGPIDDFFDKVLVMAEEPAQRENRLRLLNRFVGLFERFADFAKMAG
jgi:glycyl-tRNA synthetase beta chain